MLSCTVVVCSLNSSDPTSPRNAPREVRRGGLQGRNLSVRPRMIRATRHGPYDQRPALAQHDQQSMKRMPSRFVFSAIHPLNFSHLLKLSYRGGQLKYVVAALEKGVDPREDGVVLDPPGVRGALDGGLGLVVEVGRLEAAQDLLSCFRRCSKYPSTTTKHVTLLLSHPF